MSFEIKSRAESLEYSTLRIVCDGGLSVGTGFFFTFHGEKSLYAPVLITNKHVIKDMSSAELYFHTLDIKSGKHNKLDTVKYFDLQKFITMHPDPKIDLCTIALKPAFDYLNNLGKEAIYCPYIESDIFIANGEKDIFNTLSNIQTVHMTGYPNALWDDVNNKPITRRGITASNLHEDWQGQPDFMIDMACFPGSSGSPVYVFDEGAFTSGNSMVTSPNGRLLLLGVLHKGPIFNANGEVNIINIPTSSKAVTTTGIMMNLGIVVKSEKILDFRELFFPSENES
ncbi:serine protease [Erwinia sp. P7711]|uniref:S1 family peptidase n=1 Tax=Erwinia sp. P7711 TaxID=3141451 RepID=UPI00318BC1AD